MNVRKEVLDFGLLPAAALSPKFESLTAITDFHSKLVKEAKTLDGQRGFVSVAAARRLLGMSADVWSMLFSYLHSVTCRSSRQRWRLCSEDETKIDLHALSLFLLVQIYGRQTSRRADCELQPNMRENLTARSLLPRSLSTPTFSAFLKRHLQSLLFLIKDNPPELSSPGWCLALSPSPRLSSSHMTRAARCTISITRKEAERLDLLLQKRTSDPSSQNRTSQMSTSIVDCLPCFKNHVGEEITTSSTIELATCLKNSILDDDHENDAANGAGKICGTTKGTLVEGEDRFPDGQLVIHECQDSCIYALAPLARAKVTACSDCIIVLGPTTGSVIVENCTRIKLIYAAASTCITACHECILHLATTRPPLLFGDNRLLQLAPYNIEYERLEAHLEMAQLPVTPNRWDRPIVLSLFRDHQVEETDTNSEGTSACGLEESNRIPGINMEQLMMPPDQLLPFTIPFSGGSGPLAGGAPSNSQIFWVNRLGSGLGNGPPFRLSPTYADALTTRLRKVAYVQETVSGAISDLNNRRDIQAAIQRYFKEWLFKTGKIRQVYDLAKLEQQMISETNSADTHSGAIKDQED